MIRKLTETNTIKYIINIHSEGGYLWRIFFGVEYINDLFKGNKEKQQDFF